MKQPEASGPPRRAPKPSPLTSSWTEPLPTDVIQYVYLWRAEKERGLEDGRKIRPCLVLSTFRARGQLRVITAPITTRNQRSEERRGGKEGVSTCRSRGTAYHKKKKKTMTN